LLIPFVYYRTQFLKFLRCFCLTEKKMEAELESLEQMQARHRRELKDLQGKITNKKKNATKKTRKAVNDECAEMERSTRERQTAEVASLTAPKGEQQQEDPASTSEVDEAELAPKDGDVAEKVRETPESKLEKLQLSEPSASTTTQPPGKKRNRQKDRMARRAAEQEAASVRAEEEAANMTDHRARESEYMKKMFTTHSLEEKEIAPDGHCLFSAVADQLGQYSIPLGAEPGEPGHKTMRRAAAAYMLENGDDFAPFLEEDLADYAARMRDTAEWGGQLELMALARRYGVELRVVQDGRTEHIGEEEGKASGRTLWLAYYRHGYGLGEHYNSLRKAATTATTTTTTTAAG
jgi:OTU domain-containing protein 6